MKEQYIWEDPTQLQVNKEDGNVLALPFDSEEDALSEQESRYYYSLNGSWQFFWQRGIDSQKEGFEAPDYDDGDWGEMKVPACWQMEGVSTPYYYASTYPRALSRAKGKIPSIDRSMQEIGYYRRRFTMPAHFDGRELFLHIGACKAALELWVNGTYAGYSCGSMTPHEFDVTKLVHSGENCVAIKVYRYAASTYLEDQDMWWFSGIYREVYLYAEPKACLRDFFFSTDLDEEYKNADVTLEALLVNYSDKAQKVKLSAHLQSDTDKVVPLGEVKGKVASGERLSLTLKETVKNPKKWSAEAPNLYTLVLTLLQNGKPVCVKTYRVGFKKVEIIGEKLLFNGMPLLLRGTNRHDFDPDHGWAVPKERYIQDFDLMKQANINAIRCSHYPDDPYFYELANRYGFYVMDECDLETHGVRRKGVPGSDPKWTGLAVDKMERMVLRDRNHPCIFMWSLGNEAGDGDNFGKMKEAALALDATRPFHYEGDFSLETSDVISRMYPDEATMRKLGERQPIELTVFDNIANQLAADSKPIREDQYTKPVLLCEYAHSMENSLGNFQEYMDDFEKYDNLCGGFIWDWVDQAIRRVEADGTENWLYGTDFEKEEPRHWYSGFDKTAMTGSNTYFCANGVIGAERTPHPQYDEVRHVYRPIVTTAFDVTKGRFNVRSRFLFTDVASFKCKWKIECEGTLLQSGEQEKFSLNPLQEEFIDIPYNYTALPQDKECVLTISFHTKKKTPGLKSNAEIAWDQFLLTEAQKPVLASTDAALQVEHSGNTVTVEGDGFTVKIAGGRVTAYCVGEDNLLTAPIEPNYFRALTDNDIDVLNFAPPLIHLNGYYKWRKATSSVKAIKTNVEENNGAVKIKTALSAENMKESYVSYTIFPDGRLAVYHSAVPKADPLRFGMRFGVSGALSSVSWYGRGPSPCYPDRKTGSKLGVYTMGLDQFEYTYMRPQESSARADVRYFTLTDKKHCGIKVTAYYNEPMLFSALPYTPEALEDFTHVAEVARTDSITVTVDSAQQGVGGDMPGQAYVRDKYKVKAGEKQHLSFLFEPVMKKKK